MLYTEKNLESLIHGAIGFDRQNGAVLAKRFTQDQFDAIVGFDSTFAARARWNSGVFFEFTTLAEDFCLDFDVLSMRTSKDCMTVLENGALTGEYTIGAETKSIAHVFKTKGEKRVEIWLPVYALLALKALSCDGASPVKRGKKAAIFGDSITQGWFCEHPHLSYAAQITRKLNLDAVNYAIAAYGYDANFTKQKICVQPDVAFVAFGTNDYRILDGNAEKFEQVLAQYYRNLFENIGRVPTFVITPIWRPDREDEIALPWSGIIEKECAKHGNITVINGYDLVPHDTAMFTDLRLHPNDEGMTHYADGILQQVNL